MPSPIAANTCFDHSRSAPLTKPGSSEMNSPGRENGSESGYAAANSLRLRLGEPRWRRPQHAVHRYVGVGACRADTAASGGMMCLSCLATRHHRTPEHASVRAEPDDLYAGSHAG